MFWYRFIFLSELVVSEALATYTLKKRNLFPLRVVFSVLLIYTITFFLPSINGNVIYVSALFLFMFVLTIAAMMFCYDESFVNIIFCGIVAYTIQHIAYETEKFFLLVFGLESIDAVYVTDNILKFYNSFTLIIYISVYLLVYWLAWSIVYHKIRVQDELRINNLFLFIFVAAIILFDIILNNLVIYWNQSGVFKKYMLLICFYNVAFCLLAIIMQFSVLDKNTAEKELETVENLWVQDKKNYEFTKENIDLINAKCHDLKHMIRSLYSAERIIDKETLKEVERAINFYDGAIKTGNDILDVIFAEKLFYCGQHNIRLTCMADGEILNFMSAGDIYSFFENAIQNAIEAVLHIPEEEQRLIRLKITGAGNMISVHIENTIAANYSLKLVDGLPETIKGDKNYHGYGMKSMKMIAEKYDGALNISVEDGMFILDAFMSSKCRRGN